MLISALQKVEGVNNCLVLKAKGKSIFIAHNAF
jgi:hypothetical protein